VEREQRLVRRAETSAPNGTSRLPATSIVARTPASPGVNCRSS
jgi:hypothetical protein